LDPLVAWQRDGFEMFGQLMSSIDDDYVKIVMHAQVQVLPTPVQDTADLSNAVYAGPVDPVQGVSGIARAALAGPAPGEEVTLASEADVAAARAPVPAHEVARPVVADEVWDRVGRNDACPCGSGKKFKFCHGR
ncbi:MAG: SEC-C metal-binding domain-containing protein, partial [Actinomycetota bacterium]|nr:SEC-C metal-binding domain-containing protein [Actinomycetota bacterium]